MRVKKIGNIAIKHLTKEPLKILLSKLNQIELSPKHCLTIDFKTYILNNRSKCIWYGGDVVEISYKNHKFVIGAYGDVRAWLYDKTNNNQIAYIKDKGNNGNFLQVMHPYLKSDECIERATEHIHDHYFMEVDDHNWWECSIFTPDGEHHDLSWVLDSDCLYACIEDVLTEMDKMVENYVKTKFYN